MNLPESIHIPAGAVITDAAGEKLYEMKRPLTVRPTAQSGDRFSFPTPTSPSMIQYVTVAAVTPPPPRSSFEQEFAANLAMSGRGELARALGHQAPTLELPADMNPLEREFINGMAMVRPEIAQHLIAQHVANKK
jgi:hypothetical protein